MATHAEKPEYLGLLNAISLGESDAGVYLEAWANATTDDDLACTLRLVAARERSHGEVFCRRISELGFELRPKADAGAAARLAKYANPRIGDLEKIGPERDDTGTRDFFADTDRQIADGYFDPMTCNLMQWYITEEKDSARRLREAYGCVRDKAKGATRARANGNGASHAATAPTAESEAIMACMTAGFSRLEKSLDKLAKAIK
jgi:hypothetical protein